MISDGSASGEMSLPEKAVNSCNEDAEIPFDNILDRLTGSDPSVTDYVLEVPARCLQCGTEITEKTLVEPAVDHN
jgi:hypothetical protein